QKPPRTAASRPQALSGKPRKKAASFPRVVAVDEELGCGASPNSIGSSAVPALTMVPSPRTARARSNKELPMGKQRWTRRWKHWVAKTRLPGVWRIKEGGFIVRTRLKNPYTGRMREVRRILPEVDPHAALQWLEQERERVQSEFLTGARQRQRFCDYAICVLEAKVAKGDLTTEDSQLRWKHTLEHLIGGTFHEDGKLAVLGFGELFVDEIRASHIEAWKT